jgi:hypothetical protein
MAAMNGLTRSIYSIATVGVDLGVQPGSRRGRQEGAKPGDYVWVRLRAAKTVSRSPLILVREFLKLITQRPVHPTRT